MAVRRKFEMENLGRVLESHEQAGPAALVRFHFQDALAFEKHVSPGDLVAGMSGNRLGQRALPGSVRSHQRVHLSVTNRQVDAAEDVGILALHSRVKIPDFQQIFSHPVHSRAVSNLLNHTGRRGHVRHPSGPSCQSKAILDALIRYTS
jgi:hypothetical protein